VKRAGAFLKAAAQKPEAVLLIAHCEIHKGKDASRYLRPSIPEFAYWHRNLLRLVVLSF
jgi:hypothetical protein